MFNISRMHTGPCLLLAKNAILGVTKRRHALVARASGSVEEALSLAKDKMSRDDRVGALRAFEKAAEEDRTDEERKVLLYNITSIHGSMGDLELAQISLRQALALGLNFDEALSNPSPGMLPWRSSQQVLISLRKFAKAMENPKESKKSLKTGGPARGVELTPKGIQEAAQLDDVSELLGAEIKGMDTSLFGVVKRVAVLLLALTGLGAALFVLGLKFMFPE